MALKTQKPNYGSSDTEEQLSFLIEYIDELTEEIEFRFDVITEAINRLRIISNNTSEGSETN